MPPEPDTISLAWRRLDTWNTMKLLLFLANAFINTFGITQPSEEAAGRAARFIAALIGLVLLIVVAIAGVAIYILARH